ncbi:MAG: hypothetical protein LBS31_10020 [Candidatus Adiutrix sp.]|jgi:ABC-2 type transport system permease protein|nr:hypothetical protein [Candidatus Adiutrix sp.]
MTDVLTILKPKLIGLANIVRKPGRGGRARFMFVAFFTLVVWFLIFLFSVRVLKNLKAGEMLGEILCRKFMGLIWIAGAALLMFSSLITALSSFYLSKDLDLLMAAPVSRESIFWARSLQSLVTAAWMPAAFMLPLFLAYGFVFKASLAYYATLPLAGLPVLAAAGFLSQAIVMFLVNMLPARRTRDVMSLLAIVVFCILYMAFRLMRPEDLVNPRSFMSTAAYLASLEAPSSAFLPTTWAVEFLWPFLVKSGASAAGWFPLALLWSTAAGLGVLTSIAAAWLYWPGYNKSVEGAGRQKTVGGLLNMLTSALGALMKPERRALVVKDLKIFFRDHTQWSQLLLLAALLIIYIYNFSVLNLGRFPLHIFFLENAFAFLNLGLAALVAATLALRFAFPSISGEGFSYWIIKSAPLSLKDFMWIKYWLWMPPIWLTTMLLVAAGNGYLKVGPVMNIASLLITGLSAPGLCALAIGLGAMFPRFEAENLAQVPTGYGGLVYMVASSLVIVAVIGLSVWPLATFLNIERGVGRWTPASGGLSVVLLLAVLAIICLLIRLPMRQGHNALTTDDEEEPAEKRKKRPSA